MLLTSKQKKLLVNKVNEKINLPILGENIERKLFEKAIDKILRVLEKELPEEILQYLNDVSNGILPADEHEQEDARKSLVNLLNKEINIPLINEKKEQKFFLIVVETLFEAMKKGNKIEG